MPQSESWPYEEAQRILDRVGDPKAEIILQTGFGPSGFPHIGTFGEVTRTTFIRRALGDLGATNVRLFVFSDDMDALRKVPLNFPDSLGEHLGRALNEIPDPFNCCDSFSGHMNGKLNQMLGRFGFDYEFRSSVIQYKSGLFNNGLRAMLENVEKIRGIILPTLGAEKRDAWSPFLPICSKCRRMSTTRVTAYLKDKGAVAYVCDGQLGQVKGCGNEAEALVTDGQCKVGWKADWALRWFVYGVTYEMYGKDLIESADLSGKIVKALGGKPPVNFFFELFLDEAGAKISKSVGKGVTVDTWLKYAPVESLALFMLRNPRRAKKLFLGVIPQQVDELLGEIDHHYKEEEKDGRRSTYRFLNPDPPAHTPYVANLSYGTLTSLAGTLGSPEPEIVVQYVKKGFGWPAGDDVPVHKMIEGAVLFDREVLAPDRKPYKPVDEKERAVVQKLHDALAQPRTGEEIQNDIYAIGKDLGLGSGAVFKTLYQVIIGQERGPRLGLFIPVLGQDKVREILKRALD